MSLNPITYIQITVNISLDDSSDRSSEHTRRVRTLERDYSRRSSSELTRPLATARTPDRERKTRGGRDVNRARVCGVCTPTKGGYLASRRRVDDIMPVVNTPTARDSIDHHPTRAASRPLASPGARALV